MADKKRPWLPLSMRWLYRWHRRVSILTALFVVMLVFTGIILNHTHDLALNHTHVEAGWVNGWYGLPSPQTTDFPGITWDRLLLDIHSGRILGQWGVWLVDLASLGFLFLAMTGFIIWLRKPRTSRPRPQSDNTP